MQNVIRSVSDYLRMIKFSHSLFALPFAGVAAVEILSHPATRSLLPSGTHRWMAFTGVVVCMVSMRSAAMGFNRLVDRHYDALNPRTAMREIPAGAISVRSATFFVALSLLVFVGSAFLIQPLAGLLSPVAIAVTLGYSFTKRFTWLCHIVLGLALGLVPPAVWVAMTGTVSLEPVLWMIGVTLYTAGFDILYAVQDMDFDRQHGLHSVPARFGLRRSLQIARGLHVLSFSAFAGAAVVARTGLPFGVTLLIVGGLFGLQHWLVRGGRIDRIPIAFFHVNASISAILLGGLLVDRLVLG